MCKIHIERIASQWQMKHAVQKEEKNNNKEKYREEKNGSCARRGHHWSGATSNAIIFFYFHPFIPFFLTFYFSIFFSLLRSQCVFLFFPTVLFSKASFSASVVPRSHFRLLSFAKKENASLRYLDQMFLRGFSWFIFSPSSSSVQTHIVHHTHTRIQSHMRRFSMYGIRMLCVYLLWIFLMMYLFSI